MRLFILFVVMLLVGTPVFAGVAEVVGGITSFIADHALASLITGVLGLGVVWFYVGLVAKLGVALGTVLIAVCTPFLDRKLEKSEVADMKAALTVFKQSVNGALVQVKERKRG